MQFDGESFINDGNKALGIAMLQAVARWEEGDDLTDPAIDFARGKLQELGESW